MKKIDLGQAITILANLGVIAGIVFLAVEIRQNSELMRIQINQARADAAMASNEQSFNSPFIPPILVKIQEGTELNAEESARYINYFRAMSRNQDNVLSQYAAGMLSENTPRSVIGFVCDFIGTSAGLEAWETTKHGYTDSYIEFVERALKDCE